MKSILCVVSLCILSIAALPSKGLSKPALLKDLGSRIINGDTAELGQFPWQVAVYLLGEDQTHFCGGSLIGDEWVLTAGHCVSGFSSFQVILGTIDLNGENLTTIDSDSSHLHENFSIDPIQNDIGLIHLSEKVTLTDTIQIIPLTDDEELANGVEVTVSGWGKISDESTVVSPTLNYVKLVTLKNNDCKIFYGDSLGDDIVCADFLSAEVVQSPCNGDSGGPVVTNADSDPVHVAIVSFGSDLGCESGMPSGYTRTAYFRDWIKEKTGI